MNLLLTNLCTFHPQSNSQFKINLKDNCFETHKKKIVLCCNPFPLKTNMLFKMLVQYSSRSEVFHLSLIRFILQFQFIKESQTDFQIFNLPA